MNCLASLLWAGFLNSDSCWFAASSISKSEQTSPYFFVSVPPPRSGRHRARIYRASRRLVPQMCGGNSFIIGDE